MAISCGPHHLIHGIQAIDGMNVNWMMLMSDLLALPAGAGVRGAADRGALSDGAEIASSRERPGGCGTMTALFWCVCRGSLAAAIARARLRRTLTRPLRAIFPNALVLVTYGMVGVLLFRTQLLRHRPPAAGRSPGLSLAAIFPTCALTHVVYGLTASYDLAICPADWFGIPASIYFLWVVNRLYTRRRSSTGTVGRSSARAVVPSGLALGAGFPL